MPENMKQYSLELQSVARSYGGHSHPVSTSGQLAWAAASSLLSRVPYTGKDGEVIVRVDWQPIRQTFDTFVRIEDLPREEATRFYDEHGLSWDRRILPVYVEVQSQESLRNAAAYAQVYLYDFFLTLNLASPGSCDFYRAKLVTDGTWSEPAMGLTSEGLEASWIDALDQGWSFIQYIPLERVFSWLRSFDIGTRAIATSRAERAMFALLHVCIQGSYTPESLIWIAHALEALYKTPLAMITKYLQDRVCTVLEVPLEPRKAVCKRLREFYELRSSFVHGGMPITHPLGHNSFDSSAQSQTGDLIKAVGFGTMVVLATLQRHIVNGWREIEFSETYSGVPLPFPSRDRS